MKKSVTVLIIFLSVFISSAVCYATETGRTQLNDYAVFIDEQPVFTYFYENKNYIAVINLEHYGFDVGEDESNITRNMDKSVGFAPESLINKKKDDALFLKTYGVSQNN